MSLLLAASPFNGFMALVLLFFLSSAAVFMGKCVFKVLSDMKKNAPPPLEIKEEKLPEKQEKKPAKKRTVTICPDNVDKIYFK